MFTPITIDKQKLMPKARGHGGILKAVMYKVNQPEVEVATRTVSDLILEYLAQIDVDHIFGIPGGAIEPLFDAIARRVQTKPIVSDRDFKYKVQSRGERSHSGIVNMVVARHEAGAAFMADGYSRETGKLGVCCATTGPGTTNLITGVASAYADRTPMLVITPQIALPNFGKNGLQDSSGDAIDVVRMFEPCTRYNTFVSHVDQLEHKLFEAIHTAFRHPRGPVHLSIPMDILKQSIGNKTAQFHVATLMRQPQSFDRQGFDALLNILKKSKKTVLFLGAGCLQNAHIIVAFAQLINAKIVTTPAAKGCISAYNPIFCGVFGFAGHKSAKDVLTNKENDTVLAIGTTLSELETGGWCSESILNEKLIHIDSAMENFSRSPMACLHVFGHIMPLFKALIKAFSDIKGYTPDISPAIQEVPPSSLYVRPRGCGFFSAGKLVEISSRSHLMPDGFGRYHKHAAPKQQLIKPQFLMCELTKRLPENTHYYIDAGNAWAWATHYLHLKRAGSYQIGMGFGAMAWAIGASIGAAIGRQKKTPIACITGDGSYLMSGQEMTVAVAEELPVIFVVLNDQVLGMVKHGQKLGGGEPIGFELPRVNFAMMADAVGAKGYEITTLDEFLEFDFKKACSQKGPILLDIHVDAEEVPPMGTRMKTLDQ